jgi:hypothetical protein
VRQAQEMKQVIKTEGGVTTSPEFFKMKQVAQELVDAHKKK